MSQSVSSFFIIKNNFIIWVSLVPLPDLSLGFAEGTKRSLNTQKIRVHGGKLGLI